MFRWLHKQTATLIHTPDQPNSALVCDCATNREPHATRMVHSYTASTSLALRPAGPRRRAAPLARWEAAG